jgi:hypothetical protein
MIGIKKEIKEIRRRRIETRNVEGGKNLNDGATSIASTAGVTTSIIKLPLRTDTVFHIRTNAHVCCGPKH